MAMGALQGQGATLQVAMACLDELVSEDCLQLRLCPCETSRTQGFARNG
jgi:hypothetical protein